MLSFSLSHPRSVLFWKISSHVSTKLYLCDRTTTSFFHHSLSLSSSYHLHGSHLWALNQTPSKTTLGALGPLILFHSHYHTKIKEKEKPEAPASLLELIETDLPSLIILSSPFWITSFLRTQYHLPPPLPYQQQKPPPTTNFQQSTSSTKPFPPPRSKFILHRLRSWLHSSTKKPSPPHRSGLWCIT